MSDFTPRANLRLPGGGSTGTILPDEQVDIDVLNDNFRKIDALLGARNIPSASSYSGSMDGDLVYARDTKFLHMFSADEGKLVNPKFPGSNYYKGTKAQRDAFIEATEGDRWQLTDDDRGEYVRLDGVWYKTRIESSASYVGANIIGPAILVKTGISGARPGAKALVQWSPISLAKTGAAGITISSIKYTTDGTDPTGASLGMALQRSYVMASGSVTSAPGGVVPFTIPASGMLNVGLHIVGDTFYGPDEVFLTITVDN